MSVLWRLIIFFYNLIIMALALVALSVAANQKEPAYYFNLFLANPQNRYILAGVAGAILILSIVVLLQVLSPKPKTKAILLRSGEMGEVMITVPAVNTLIMKAVKKVEGSRDIKARIISKSNGLIIKVCTMVNPEYNVPELTQNIQAAIKEDLEIVGGLRVAEVKVLVDELSPTKL